MNSKATADSNPDGTSQRDAAANPDASLPADFERALAELEAIVEQLEQGELSLEESLRQFERGVQLTRSCQGALKLAEQKVQILMDRSGEPDSYDMVPFDTDDDQQGR